MKTLFKLSFLALLAIMIFNGCKKDLLLKTANQSPGKTGASSSIPDSMMMTPRGLMLKSQVHQVENGYHLEVRGNHVLKIKTATGELKEDFGAMLVVAPIQPSATSQPQTQAGTGVAKERNLTLTQPDNVTGWVTYSEWGVNAGSPIGTFSSVWTGP